METQMRGKVVLITGGTGGIGKATALGIAKLGATTVVVGRNKERAEAALAEIKAQSGNPKVDLILADLSSQADIRKLADEFTSRYDRLDVLLNNVGGLYAKRWETVDGVEASFAMNHLNVHLLTTLLLPTLKASAPSRIINVNSSGHRFAKVNFDDLFAEKWYRGLDIYVNSKLVNLLVSYELARRLAGSGVTVNIADPGGAMTDMTNGMTPEMVPWFMAMAWPLFRVFQRGQTVEKAAVSSIYLASSPDVEGVTGRYFNPSGKEVKSSGASYDQIASRRLWDITEQLLANSPAVSTVRASA
jgi:NAD(P)-dependent dehydrogenase (short-subunit alcohol dehydrogenase family)